MKEMLITEWVASCVKAYKLIGKYDWIYYFFEMIRTIGVILLILFLLQTIILFLKQRHFKCISFIMSVNWWCFLAYICISLSAMAVCGTALLDITSKDINERILSWVLFATWTFEVLFIWSITGFVILMNLKLKERKRQS
jgi:hypothetical protein